MNEERKEKLRKGEEIKGRKITKRGGKMKRKT